MTYLLVDTIGIYGTLFLVVTGGIVAAWGIITGIKKLSSEG
jgi:hypothetical protein